MLVGWSSALLESDDEENAEYKAHLEMAEEYVSRELYQKAIEEYDAAIVIESTEEIWASKLDAFSMACEENIKLEGDYLTAASAAVSQYPRNVEFLMCLSQLYARQEDFHSARSVLERAIESGINNKEVDALLLEIKYAYQLIWDTYDDYRPCSNEFYAVSDNDGWSYIKEDGGTTNFKGLTFAGPVGEKGIRVVRSDEKSYLVDSREVIQGYLNFEPLDAGFFAEGLVPISDQSGYSYYNSLGDKQFGGYTQAGAFAGGEAAVQQDGKWMLINPAGEKTTDQVYEEIRLHDNGCHKMYGVMVAKQNGVWHFFKDGTSVGGYADADIITEDKLVAISQDGKWGFVDLEGNVVIAPAFEKARSFSNGLAAVYDGTGWGFIDKNGTVVIDCVFSDVGYFNSEGCCMVKPETEGDWQMLSLYAG